MTKADTDDSDEDIPISQGVYSSQNKEIKPIPSQEINNSEAKHTSMLNAIFSKSGFRRTHLTKQPTRANTGHRRRNEGIFNNRHWLHKKDMSFLSTKNNFNTSQSKNSQNRYDLVDNEFQVVAFG